MSGGEGLEVGTGAAHDRLVVIVAQRIGVGELAEISHVTCRHIVEAHRDTALVGARGWIGAVLRALARGFRHPREQVAPAAVELLPHLEEAMHRVADICGVVDVFGDLERSIRQQLRKALVADIMRLTDRVGCARPGQFAVGADDAGRHLVNIAHLSAALHRFCEIRPGAAVAIDDTL
jgi:hypothetical protein